MSRDDRDTAALAALLALPELGPARLRAILGHHGSAGDAVEAVRAGRLDDVPLAIAAQRRAGVVRGWSRELRELDLDEFAARHRAAGVEILTPDHVDWPPTFTHDPEPPPLLFARGDHTLLGAPGVAVVGTRRCTASGAATARELGAGFAAAGVAVVSGLALGVDGIVHRAAIDAGGTPIGFVATGLDRPYPSRHHRLWDEVASAGVLVSEAALGVGPERWRFPARNRLIAAGARAVVVVESGLRGGSMITADQALERGIPVFAVPGPLRAPQSEGTNQLLFDGAAPARGAADVLGGLDMAAPDGGVGSCEAVVPADCRAVYALLTTAETPLDELARVGDVGVETLVTALARLEGIGAVRRTASGYRRAAP